MLYSQNLIKRISWQRPETCRCSTRWISLGLFYFLSWPWLLPHYSVLYHRLPACLVVSQTGNFDRVLWDARLKIRSNQIWLSSSHPLSCVLDYNNGTYAHHHSFTVPCSRRLAYVNNTLGCSSVCVRSTAHWSSASCYLCSQWTTSVTTYYSFRMIS